MATGSNILLTLYRQAFCRKRFYRLNRSLFHLGLRGMGVLNYESDHLSGERWLLEKFCRNRLKVAIDVGGNVGHYAELIVTRNDGVRLYSFEPHPRTFQALESSAARFGYVAMNLAVGAEVGYVDLFDHATNDGSEHASVFREVIEDVHHSTPTGHRVKMTTLDAFIDEKEIAKVDLLKVDTEGSEFNVLAGARKALREDRIELIHFEFNVTNVVSRVFMKDYYALLSSYQLFRMLPDGLVQLPQYGVNVAEIEVFAFQNILAIHASSPLLAGATG